MKLFQALRLTRGDVIALVGGGGKTTAMFQLANELAGSWPLLTTTSTRIFAAQIQRAPAHIFFDPDRQSVAELLPRLTEAVDVYGQVLLVGPTDAASGKAFGVSPEVIDALAVSGRFDLVINEADGSRMRPFKAPASHEPVIPGQTTVVVPVVGLDVLGQPLTDEFVHRAALVSQLSETPPGEPITPETVAAVVGHPQGGLKGVPPQARVVPLLNKAERSADFDAARRLADHLLTRPRIASVLIGAVGRGDAPINEVRGRTAAIILAAGGSSRFGTPKQLASWQGQSFIERVVETALASTAERTVVVLGAEAAACQTQLRPYPVEIVINERWAEGQSTSMQTGLATLPPGVDSAVFLLVDQPHLSPAIIDALIERHRQTLAPLVWPEFEGRRGNPVLFDRALFAELHQISGDTGGRPLLRAYSHRAERVAVTSRAILQDFDRPDDVAAFEGS